MRAAREISRACDPVTPIDARVWARAIATQYKNPPELTFERAQTPPFFVPSWVFFWTLDQGTTACLSVPQRQLTTKFHQPHRWIQGHAAILMLVRTCGKRVHGWPGSDSADPVENPAHRSTGARFRSRDRGRPWRMLKTKRAPVWRSSWAAFAGHIEEERRPHGRGIELAREWLT
jgi:hypothetical protein